jgi:hypothetical protein
MPIEYAQFENNITSVPTALVQISGSSDGNDLVQDIVGQGLTVNEPNVLPVIATSKPACRWRVEQGSLDKLYRIMRPGKTVSQPRSTPAPHLASAPALRQGVGTAPHRGRVWTSLRYGTEASRDTINQGREPQHGVTKEDFKDPQYAHTRSQQ